MEGAGDDFLVEGPEVFDAAAAAGDDDGVDAWEGAAGFGVYHGEGVGDFGGGTEALDADWDDEDAEPRGASGEDIEHVLEGGTGGGGDDRDGGGHGGDGLFEVLGEEPFGGEFLFEGFELELEGACAGGEDAADDELVLTAGFVDGEVALELEGEAVVHGDEDLLGGVFEEDAGELSGGVFEGEVAVAAGLAAEVADFAFDPEIAESGFDGVAEAAGELGDGEDAFRGIGGALGEEVHGGSVRAEIGGRGGFFHRVRRCWRGGGRRGG